MSKTIILFFLPFFILSINNELKEKKVLNDKISLLLPLDFKLMDNETLIIKYPNTGNRPTEVYTNDKGSINIAFNHTTNALRKEELSQVKTVIRQQLLNTKGVTIINSSSVKINNIDFVIIEFMSKAIDTEIYNKMFITSLENRLLLGTFNCTSKDLNTWKPISNKIISSIKK